MTLSRIHVIVLLTALATLNVVFSACTAPISTPKGICSQLQQEGLVKECQEGTPWAFEVVKHGAQWQFEPTGSEIFKCYTVGKNLEQPTVYQSVEHIPCVFKGAVTQFKSQADLNAGLEHIRQANSQPNDPTSLAANVVRANTTLEHYIPYIFPKSHLLIMMPVTENGAVVQKALESLLGPSD
jgi:hypothetical protein